MFELLFFNLLKIICFFSSNVRKRNVPSELGFAEIGGGNGAGSDIWSQALCPLGERLSPNLAAQQYYRTPTGKYGTGYGTGKVSVEIKGEMAKGCWAGTNHRRITAGTNPLRNSPKSCRLVRHD